MQFELGGGGTPRIRDAIRDLASKCDSVSVAVSYIQLSGWGLLKSALSVPQIQSLRVICTDQFGITDPNAIRAILEAGGKVRAFTGNSIFHPKVFIGSRKGMADLFLMGSANLSGSALVMSVEADLSGEDKAGELRAWFDNLFADNALSTDFDEIRLTALDNAFAARTRSRIAFKRYSSQKKQKEVPVDSRAEDAGIMESLFASLEPGVTPLNFDKAGNNVRQISMILEILHGKRALSGKAASEMKLLGLAELGQLNSLGKRAAKAQSIDSLAKIWMAWLKTASAADVAKASPAGQLRRAQVAFQIFWTLPKDVTDFFVKNSDRSDPRKTPLLQTIELLANAGRKLPALTLEDIQVLSTVLRDTSLLPPVAAEAIKKYLRNKGARGWDSPDRRLAVTAWRAAPG